MFKQHSSILCQSIAQFGQIPQDTMSENFNSFCIQDGREFEDVVISYEVNNNNSKVINRNVTIPTAGIEMDIIIYSSGEGEKFKFIQAKGGKPGDGKRPGAQRTDSVKKAIADGVLLKSALPGSWYTVYFSEKPKSGSFSEQMIETAIRGGMIDEVQYIPYG